MRKQSLWLTSLQVALALAAITMAAGCKTEEAASRFKITHYEQVYNETPEVIYIAPVQDMTSLRPNRNPSDTIYNRSVTVAAHYLYQVMATPLNRNGYYTIGGISARQIAGLEQQKASEIKNGDLSAYATRYGADAVLFATIRRWKEWPGIWTVFIDFTLRSTRTGNLMAHTGIKASKIQPYTIKGEEVDLIKESRFAKEMNFDNSTTQRCLLVEEAAAYVLRDLPLCRTTRQFRHDRYDIAISNYLSLIINDDGQYEVQPITMEEFETGSVPKANIEEEEYEQPLPERMRSRKKKKDKD